MKIGGLAAKHANHDLRVMEKVLKISHEERVKIEDDLRRGKI